MFSTNIWTSRPLQCPHSSPPNGLKIFLLQKLKLKVYFYFIWTLKLLENKFNLPKNSCIQKETRHAKKIKSIKNEYRKKNFPYFHTIHSFFLYLLLCYKLSSYE